MATMASSQPTASSGATAVAGDAASNTMSGAGSGPAPGTAAEADANATASNPPSATSKSSTPQASEKRADTPHRDKDSFAKYELDRYMTRDSLHSAALNEAQRRVEEFTKAKKDMIYDYKMVRSDQKIRGEFPPARLYGDGYRGFGNGVTELGGPSRILYPSQKSRPGKRLTPSLKYTRKDGKKQAEQHEELVPVRLDVDWDKIKLRDTFTFNLHERIVSTELFAMSLVEDMGIKAPADKPVYEQVLQQLHEQLQDFFPFAYSDEDALDPELPYSAYKNDEMRILVKLNITIGAHTLVDQFEWDINNPLNSPEEFATNMARDLALSGEFTTAIAHCIREQVQLFTRSLYSVGHPFDGRPIEDPDLVAAFLPSPLPNVFRPQQQAKDFAPYLFENTEADLERSETVFSREQRRQKRSVNRRGGPSLPDLKERQRTIRTSIVSSVIPGAAQDIEESRLYKRAGGTNAAGGRGRKAARDGELSDSEDSEDSAPDSPAMSQLQGTARTRGIRGAANAAAVRMANLGRSETPEAIIHHHETRTSRRFGREATREETEEPLQHVVTLRVSPARLRRVLQGPKPKSATPAPVHSGSATPSGQNHQRATSASAPGSMGPPSTPSASNQSLPVKTPTQSALKTQIGRVPAAPPPPPGTPAPPPPPPPAWLPACLQELLKTYPYDRFEGIMRYCALDIKTDTPLPVPPYKDSYPGIKFMYLPRIRCHDCPGKLYTPGPDMTAENFEVHLKNRHHREKVDQRVGKPTAVMTPGSTTPSQEPPHAANGSASNAPATGFSGSNAQSVGTS